MEYLRYLPALLRTFPRMDGWIRKKRVRTDSPDWAGLAQEAKIAPVRIRRKNGCLTPAAGQGR